MNIGSGADLTISNTLFIGGDLYATVTSRGDGAPTFRLANITLADTSRAQFAILAMYGYQPPSGTLANSIFSSFRTEDEPIWYFYWDEPNTTRYTIEPDAITNLYEDDGWDLSYVYTGPGSLDAALTSDAETAMLVSSTRGEATFTAGPWGSYGLDPTSLGVDAGSGDPDPDGSPADLGAFGGPDGDWYKEFPWPLP